MPLYTDIIAVTNFKVNLTNSNNGYLSLRFPFDGIVNLRDTTIGGNASWNVTAVNNP